MIATLPILMALSWVPTPTQAPVPAATQQKADQPARATDTVKCPLTGEQIPSCCCPVKK